MESKGQRIKQKIHEILDIIKEKKIDTSEASIDYISIVDSINNNVLVTIEPLVDENEKIDGCLPIGKAARFNSLIKNAPIINTIKQNEIIKDGYKVIFPEGSTGELMKYKNGFLGTPLIQSNGRIGGHAGLEELQSVSISPAIVFSVMSAVTGQYYMSKINENLEILNKQVATIINILMDDKKSRNEAILHFYEDIKNNFEIISNNNDLRIATLINVQNYLQDLNQNKIFYDKQIERKIQELNLINRDYKKTNQRNDRYNEIKNDINEFVAQQNFSVAMFAIGKLYEMQLAQIYDKRYRENQIWEIEAMVNDTIKNSNILIEKYRMVLSDIKRDAIINEKLIDEQINIVEKKLVPKYDEFQNNLKNVITSMKVSMDDGQKEFIVKEDNIYRLDDIC